MCSEIKIVIIYSLVISKLYDSLLQNTMYFEECL